MSANIVNTTDANFQADVLDLKRLYLLTSGQAGVRHVKPLHLCLKIFSRIRR
jgi:hypothetical protein